MAPLILHLFEQLYEPGTEYRTTMVLMGELEDDQVEQYELFEDRVRIENLTRASHAIDTVNERYGKHKVGLGSSLFLDQHRRTSRDDTPLRKHSLLNGETARQRLNIPRLGVRVT